MIAKVRIAPQEHWCEGVLLEAREHLNAYPAGMEVEICTDLLKSWRYCDGKVWITTPETRDSIRALGGQTETNGVAGFCEHMLEMD